MCAVQIFIIIISSSSSSLPELADPLKGVGIADFLRPYVGHHVPGVDLDDDERGQRHAADAGQLLAN